MCAVLKVTALPIDRAIMNYKLSPGGMAGEPQQTNTHTQDKAVVPKVGGIAPLGSVKRSRGAVKQKGAAGWH